MLLERVLVLEPRIVVNAPQMINRTSNNNNNETTTHFNKNVHMGFTILRVGPLMVYLRFSTLIFSRFLIASHPNLSERSVNYQRLIKRLIFISSVLLGMLIWIIETEFMGLFLKYVIVSHHCINYPPSSLQISL